MLVLLATLARATCPSSLAAVRDDVARRDLAELLEELPCLADRATPEDAAAIRGMLDLGAAATRFELVPPPDAGDIWFDGRISNERPVDGPTLFQQTAKDGHVVQTAYLRPGDPLPAYLDAGGRQRRTNRLSPLTIGLGAAGLAAFAVGAGVAIPAVEPCITTGEPGACGQRDAGAGVAIGGMLTMVVAGLTINLQI